MSTTLKRKSSENSEKSDVEPDKIQKIHKGSLDKVGLWLLCLDIVEVFVCLSIISSYLAFYSLCCLVFVMSCLCVILCCCLALSCFVLSCLVLSCLVLSCLVLSCLVVSCRVVSCLALSCLVLSCLYCMSLPLFCSHSPHASHLNQHRQTRFFAIRLEFVFAFDSNFVFFL
jgi:hypothetical protein